MKIAPPAGASAWTAENFRAQIQRMADPTGSS
jgi:hypothetical protein